MKLALFFAFIIASVNAIAQEPPSAVTKPLPPKPHDAYKAKAAPMAPLSATKLSNEELSGLLRAQTNAIKSLSSKLDSLEERIGKIEKGGR
ncbi:MAG: hypothetical protein Q8J90_04775 [Gallionella sp.]|nr:hypothetical protein [Gallionella sp.]